eukprot:2324727-Rhodomonas_salina.1
MCFVLTRSVPRPGMAASSPSMLTGAQPSMALAVPVAAPTPAPSSPTSSSEQKPLRASPAHLLLPAHAFLLAAIQVGSRSLVLECGCGCGCGCLSRASLSRVCRECVECGV